MSGPRALIGLRHEPHRTPLKFEEPLIHGYPAPAAAWALTTDALVAAGYRVMAFDRRSHGQSETPVFG